MKNNQQKEYIEREAVTNHIDFVVNNAPDTDYKKAAWGFGVFVSRLPAADVAPVRHGCWVKEKPDVLIHWHCSVCEECYFLEEPNADYCPHCGAKMDGGD